MPVFSKKYRNLSDEKLLEQFLDHPNPVLEELYKRYHVLTLGLSLKYLKDKEMAKDAVAEIFLKLNRDLSHHKIKNFKSWFYVYAKNYCLELIRKSKRQRQIEEKYIFEKPEYEYDFEIDVLLKKIRHALTELKAGQKECVEKFYLEQKSYDEISRLLSISLKQVKSHIQNGKRNLLNTFRSENKPS